ncbi:efflux RND transporter periplasmic adaptor subunit [Gluconacetobacter sp. 1c LMG 22058]|uniref:Efflux RND transporter periplasmic adaptor subunit n=1 Tax=Gluconacetobacter dulcium TaxID=2729096 RepID=A0A7W4K1R6_9PROT|nr:efflux RND transporter periplasmic adaptor subunit [Gluconacetobacter dulcium]MBB2198794.1 efflux RND transporter periplasmic adaptor subunit [Gluconacetobacter dulcium]
MNFFSKCQANVGATLVSAGCVFGTLMAAIPVVRAQESWPKEPVIITQAALTREGIETAQAEPGALPNHIEAQAYVAADERRISRIRPVGTGRVTDVLVSPGQVVKRGDTLLRYDDFSLSDERQRLLSAEDALRQAQAQERDAVLTWQRGEHLRGGIIASGEAERRRAHMVEMHALVSQREAEVQNEKERMGRFSSPIEKVDGLSSTVISPVNGIVRHVNISVGEAIATLPAIPIEIDNLDSVWVISEVSTEDAGKLAIGGQQQTWLRGAGDPIASRIDLIEGGVDIGTRRVLVRSLVPNAQSALRPGMLARTRLFFSHPVAGQVIPTSALQTIAGQKCVFVQIGRDRYASRHVVVGPSLDGRTVLTQGVAAGEAVVTRGSFVLKSQALLNPAPESRQVEK